MVQRLRAPHPGWRAYADTVVVGSGVAGITAALAARQAGSVLLVTKARLQDGSTRWAQGGIAAALGVGDTPEAHLQDTLVAGAGVCDEDAVRALVTEGPAAVRRLIALGAEFDKNADGDIALGREGGHLARRIAHAGGDATGKEVSRALIAALEHTIGEIEVIDHALVLDLLKDEHGGAAGVTLHVMGEGARDGVGAVHAKAVVLATGGMGQVFDATTNPSVATGDGVALALRAGAAVADLEFVQFHPTVMWLGGAARGQQPLISEAVRGEGAYLVDGSGVRFMVGQHPLAELAPRDVVAKGIMRRMAETGEPHVWLDARTGVGEFSDEYWRTRFPTIRESCLQHGIDPAKDLIPVAPAEHFASGGVRTDIWGRTSIPRLYACGEVACTGVHGANRLASNSLLEGLVFAERIGADLGKRLPWTETPVPVEAPEDVVDVLLEPSVMAEVQHTMTAGAGVLRTAELLDRTADELERLAERGAEAPHLEAWEATNLHLLASALVKGAALRTETRGSHWREDYPESADRWLVRLATRLDPATGNLITEKQPLRSAEMDGVKP
ncbi:L-aspartate oxidase [Catenulispora sp. MAP12-49]|jgi:L-aspartate oxidase|uniref:L-aspartate oxidase n=1 Tax=unclassified Catenulispora TaxID=414885 RepID=UPI00351635CF